jgi:methionyl-tRNA formyltransferase
MLRVVFMGTPPFAVPTSTRIAAAGHQVVAVYTQPPRPAERGLAVHKSAVQLAAERHGWRVHSPRTLKDASEQQAIAALAADVVVVVAYGLILPRAVLDAPRLGCLNLHASALPRWRGAAPIARAIMAGDTRTAATVMRMTEGLDEGPICASESIDIPSDMTAGGLAEVMAESGALLMVRALAALERGELTCTPQAQQGASYAAKVAKAEAQLTFELPAEEVHNRVRGLSPAPGAWLALARGDRSERVKVLATTLGEGAGPPGKVLDSRLTIACARGAVRLLALQRPGRKPVTAAEFLRGFPVAAGSRLPAGR